MTATHGPFRNLDKREEKAYHITTTLLVVAKLDELRFEMNKAAGIEFYILEALESAESPIGAGAIRTIIRKQGIQRSEAGIGIILRDLQTKNYVRKDGFRGHVITVEGMEFLESQREYRKQSSVFRSFYSQINSEEESLMDEILHARRAIETEAAGLAAERATDEQVAEMRNNLDSQKKLLDVGMSNAELDRQFHALILEAAGNSLLQSMYQLIGMNEELSKFFEEVRIRKGSRLGIDHLKVFEAISSRDPVKAAQDMANHIDHTIEASKEYFKSSRVERDKKARRDVHVV